MGSSKRSPLLRVEKLSCLLMSALPAGKQSSQRSATEQDHHHRGDCSPAYALVLMWRFDVGRDPRGIKTSCELEDSRAIEALEVCIDHKRTAFRKLLHCSQKTTLIQAICQFTCLSLTCIRLLVFEAGYNHGSRVCLIDVLTCCIWCSSLKHSVACSLEGWATSSTSRFS